MDEGAKSDMPTMGDRLGAALIGALALELTAVVAILAAVYCAAQFPLLIIDIRPITYTVVDLSFGLPLWGLCTSVVGGLVGFTLGMDRLFSYMGHLWGTGTPRRPYVTLSLWAALVAFIGASLVVATHAL